MPLTTMDMIVAILGDILKKEYFYNADTDEVYYYRDDNVQVVTPFNTFVSLAFDKWTETPEENSDEL